MTNRLFEAVLNEADKSRFINKMYDLGEEKLKSFLQDKYVDVPNKEDLIKWVNSGAADRYHFDWNKTSNRNIGVLFVDIVLAYERYKYLKKTYEDSKTQFNDPKKFHIIMETDDWLFVSPLTWEACQYIDSFKCGGAGARWCIGWQMSDQYWEKYLCDDYMFILALSKRKDLYGTDFVKFMMQIKCTEEHIYVRTWKQPDDPEDTLNKEETERVIGVSIEELLSKYSYDQFSEDIEKFNKKVARGEINWTDYMYNDDFTSWVASDRIIAINNVAGASEVMDIGKLLEKCSNREYIERIVIEGDEDMLQIGDIILTNSENYNNANSYFPILEFTDFDELYINRIIVGEQYHDKIALRHVRSCEIKTVDVANLYQASSKEELFDTRHSDTNLSVERYLFTPGRVGYSRTKRILKNKDWVISQPEACMETFKGGSLFWDFRGLSDKKHNTEISGDIFDMDAIAKHGNTIITIINGFNVSVTLPKLPPNIFVSYANCRGLKLYNTDQDVLFATTTNRGVSLEDLK